MTTRKRVDASKVLQDSPAVTSTTSGPDLPATSTSQQAPTTRYDLRVLTALRQIIRAVDLYSRQLLGQHKVTGPQLITLLTVENYGSDTTATEDSSCLGWEWDLFCNWRITSDLAWTLRYGAFMPSGAYDSGYDSCRQFLYTGVVLSF